MKSLKLDIKTEAGDHYWTEHFNSDDDLQKWIETEKSRPYWEGREAYQFIVTDLTPRPPTAEETAAREAKEQEIKDRHAALKKLKKADLADLPACADAIMKIIKHLGIE